MTMTFDDAKTRADALLRQSGVIGYLLTTPDRDTAVDVNGPNNRGACEKLMWAVLSLHAKIVMDTVVFDGPFRVTLADRCVAVVNSDVYDLVLVVIYARNDRGVKSLSRMMRRVVGRRAAPLAVPGPYPYDLRA